MRNKINLENPSMHLLAELRLRNYFADHIKSITSKYFKNDSRYPEFESLLNQQNNFEIMNYLFILVDTYYKNNDLLSVLIDTLKKD